MDYEHLRSDLERVRLRNKELLSEIEILEGDRKAFMQQVRELNSKES